MARSSVVQRFRAVLPVLTVAVAGMFALRRLDDFDTWWHLASGRWIAQHHIVPRTDTLSFTVPDHPWINLQWLFDLVSYALYQAGGADLLVLSAALTFGLAIALLIRNLRFALGLVGSSAVAFWVTLIAQERFSVRPEMVSFVCLEIMLWLFASARRDDGRRLWLLSLVMVVWVNTHALFIIGVLIIGCHLGAVVLARLPLLPAGWRAASTLTPAATRRVLVNGAAALLVTVANPYGLEGALFPLKLLSRINGASPAFRSISEFQPPFSGGFSGLTLQAYECFLLASVMLVAAAGILTARRPRGGVGPAAGAYDVANLAIFAGLAYLSLLARRNMALFALGAAPFVGQCALIVKVRLPRALRRAWNVTAGAFAVVLPLGLVVMAWLVTSNGFYRWSMTTVEFGAGVLAVNFPLRAAEFIRQMQLPPRLYNDITSGGYLAWDRPVGDGVYIDGRLEVYDEPFVAAYRAAQANPDRWPAEADRIGVQTVLLTHRNPSRHRLIRWLLMNPRWVLVYFDEVAVVFVRQAGNEQRIAACRQMLPAIETGTAQALLAPLGSWQWPAGRVQALSNYAGVLDMMGRAEAAMQFDSRLLDLGLPRMSEAIIRLRLAQRHARRGELAAARLQLARAAAADPGNRQVAELRARIGGSSGSEEAAGLR